ncbi:hypothetical protein TMPK1_10680 [Rhodospirillales bacterium TMPK1]|uniref:Uncharacterized protein n=1 Tax=Roseiterribacter gracilis TaxID=2812848 RepID=A0A8S8XAE5_9PROT|nr:hypothetical protein TMPK1_10680 [Rhodospirillales bacterium TMPK1]
MKIAAAEIESGATMINRVGTAADPVARFEQHDVNFSLVQQTRGGDACGTRADDGNINFIPKRHDLPSSA